MSEKRRVYALDTIGDIGRSELADPDRYPKKGRDYSAWLDDVYEQLEITQGDVVAGGRFSRHRGASITFDAGVRISAPRVSLDRGMP